MYLLLRDTVESNTAIELVKNSFRFIASFEGEIPGTSRVECGNYLEHNLEGAKANAREILEILENWTTEKLRYKG